MKTPVKILAVVFAVAALARLVCLATPTAMSPDSHAYLESMQALLTHQWAMFRVERTPGYPLFLIATMGLSTLLGHADPAVLTVLIQSMLGCLTALLVCEVTQRLLNTPWLSLVAGLACAVSPDLILYEHHVLSESLYAFLLMVYALLTLLVIERDSIIKTVWLALTGALLLWTRVIALPVVMISALAFWLAKQRQLLAVYSVMLLLAIGSWMAFQYQAHGYIGYAAGSGLNQLYKTVNFVDYDSSLEGGFKQLLWQRMQLHPPSQSYEAVNDVHVIHAQANWRLPYPKPYDQVYLADDQSARRIVFEAVREEPVSYLMSTARQLGTLLMDGTEWDPHTLFWNPVLLLALLGLTAGLVRLREKPWPALCVLSLMSAGQFLLYPWMTVCVARYRIPLEPLTLILAAEGLLLLSTACKTAGVTSKPNSTPQNKNL